MTKQHLEFKQVAPEKGKPVERDVNEKREGVTIIGGGPSQLKRVERGVEELSKDQSK